MLNNQNELVQKIVKKALGISNFSPMGALVNFGSKLLSGENRQKAKIAGEQAQQIADSQVEIARNRLNEANQTAQNIFQNESDLLQKGKIQDSNIIQNNVIDDETYKQLLDAKINSSIPQQFNNPESFNNISSQQENNKNRQNTFGDLANGLNNFIEGYNENRTQSFSPDNLKFDSNKGFLTRLGEGLGTASRIIQNPIAQGVVAGGLSAALTGNPLYGLGVGYRFANNRLNSDLYKDILSQQGINPGSLNGVISSDDLVKILSSKKLQKDYITRADYDRLRLENGGISLDEYNSNLSDPNYNPDELVNITGVKTVSKAIRNEQENKNDRSKNYYRSKNDGKNVVKVEYDKKPDSHSYTHVIYGKKPDSHSYTHVTYGEKPSQKNSVQANYSKNPELKNNNVSVKNSNDNQTRVKVQSPDGKVGSIPANQLLEAIKQGYKKISGN